MSWSVVVCAVLSGVDPKDLDVEMSDDALTHESSAGSFAMLGAEEVRRMLVASTNSSDTSGLETGAIVAIVLGGVAVLILVVGIVWWFTMRTKGAMSTDYSYTRPGQQSFAPIPFSGTASESLECQVEMPLLKLGTGAKGANAWR